MDANTISRSRTMTTQRTRITIRQAGAGDHERIASLARETFVDSFAADNRPEDMAAYLAKAFGPSIQAMQLAEPSSLFMIAETGHQPAGYARLVEASAPACIDAKKPIQLSRLYVRKPWIGKGVGAVLMTACIDEAMRRRCDGIWLGVWGKNSRAIRFYNNWGFVQKGTQPFVLGSDRQTDLILWRPLNVPPR
jgi:GNAT superfamily N-acetyltransferase